MAKHHRHYRSKRTIFPTIVIVVLLAAIFWLLQDTQRKEAAYKSIAAKAGQHTKERVTVTWQDHTYALREDLKSIVLIGIDEDSTLKLKESRNPGQCDFVAVLVLDEQEESLTLLPINRDTMCVVPMLDGQGKVIGTKRQQLALAHTYGAGGIDSCRNVVKSVSNLLYGVPLNGFARIRMDCIPAFNDAVGGVTISLADDFTQFDEEMVQGEILTLSGKQAEIFVRARGSMADPTNIARMERQRTYLTAWIQAAKASSEAGNAPSAILASLSDQITSDLSIYELSDICDSALQYPDPEILTIAGIASKGAVFMEFYPDEEAMQQQIINLFYEPVKE